MPNFDKTRVLIAPLDWGLGHATRCIPIIYELLKADLEVIIAAEGKIKTLLVAEFPSAKFISLKGYNIQYAQTKWGLFFKMLFQTGKILSAIRSEHFWLDKIIDEQKIEVVISDNRYGLYNKRIISVFITHQLFIQAPLISNLLLQLNYKHINRFDICWIPDIKEKKGLAGALAHPKKLPLIPVEYIGVLSRFKPDHTSKKEKYLLILLSGPEPQRTILEKKLLYQLKTYKLPVVLVRGLPGVEKDLGKLPTNVTFFSHLETAALQEVIQQAFFVIARSGYSTIMDLVRMQKKSILIPTPGQTEQEYLAQYLFENNIAFIQSQKDFDLVKVLELAQSFDYKIMQIEDKGLLEKAIDNLSTLVTAPK